jgi:hypothetical protein
MLWHRNFRRRSITQKNEYNIQNTTKAWNQEALQFFQQPRIIYRWVQAMVIFSSYWWSEANTHKGPSYKSLFLHKAPSVTSTPHSLSLFHQEDTTEKYQFCDFNGSIYWRVFYFQFQMILRNSVWCDMPRNKGWHTTLCCILNFWYVFFS